MSRLSASQYLSAIEAESARFREALAAADPAAPVPSCPAWSALDLVNPLAEVQGQWAWVVANRPKTRDDRPEAAAAPTTYDAALTAFDEASAGLVAALRDGDIEEAERVLAGHIRRTRRQLAKNPHVFEHRD